MAKFKVAMVDYDYDSLAPIQAEVEKFGGEFVHRRCKDIDEAIGWAGDADGWIIQYLSPDRREGVQLLPEPQSRRPAGHRVRRD